MAVQMTKSQLIEKIATENEVGKKDVKGVLETLATIGYKELKKSGVFLDQSAQGHEPVHRRAHDVQGQTGPENCQSTPGQGSKRRGVKRDRPAPRLGPVYISGIAEPKGPCLGSQGLFACSVASRIFDPVSLWLRTANARHTASNVVWLPT